MSLLGYPEGLTYGGTDDPISLAKKHKGAVAGRFHAVLRVPCGDVVRTYDTIAARTFADVDAWTVAMSSDGEYQQYYLDRGYTQEQMNRHLDAIQDVAFWHTDLFSSTIEMSRERGGIGSMAASFTVDGKGAVEGSVGRFVMWLGVAIDSMLQSRFGIKGLVRYNVVQRYNSDELYPWVLIWPVESTVNAAFGSSAFAADVSNAIADLILSYTGGRRDASFGVGDAIDSMVYGGGFGMILTPGRYTRAMFRDPSLGLIGLARNNHSSGLNSVVAEDEPVVVKFAPTGDEAVLGWFVEEWKPTASQFMCFNPFVQFVCPHENGVGMMAGKGINTALRDLHAVVRERLLRVTAAYGFTGTVDDYTTGLPAMFSHSSSRTDSSYALRGRIDPAATAWGAQWDRSFRHGGQDYYLGAMATSGIPGRSLNPNYNYDYENVPFHNASALPSWAAQLAATTLALSGVREVTNPDVKSGVAIAEGSRTEENPSGDKTTFCYPLDRVVACILPSFLRRMVVDITAATVVGNAEDGFGIAAGDAPVRIEVSGLQIRAYMAELKSQYPEKAADIDAELAKTAHLTDALMRATIVPTPLTAIQEVVKHTKMYEKAQEADLDLYAEKLASDPPTTFKTAQNRINGLAPQKIWVTTLDNAFDPVDDLDPELLQFLTGDYALRLNSTNGAWEVVNASRAVVSTVLPEDAAMLAIGGILLDSAAPGSSATVTKEALTTIAGTDWDRLVIAQGESLGGDWTSLQPTHFFEYGFPAPHRLSGDALARCWLAYKGLNTKSSEDMMMSMMDVNPIISKGL